MDTAGDDDLIKGRDVGFLLFLTLLNVMNFVDRQLLGSFANWIVPDLGLTNTQFALLTGLVFRTLGAGVTNGFSFEALVYPETWYIFTICSPIVSSVVLVGVSLLTQKQSVPTPLKRNEQHYYETKQEI